ncbi:MAG: hypothetical protein PHE03_04725 [Bacteroidales bacterium]|nr:hypothetical protein [Bacteroidales bacterium]MDD3891588.1 hypothetical protein [Bacteroidales bacterium]
MIGNLKTVPNTISWHILAYAVCLLFTTSCILEYNIYGTWVIMKEEMWMEDKLINTAETSGETIKFYHDGTGIDKQGAFTWIRVKNKLIISDSGMDYQYSIRQKHRNMMTLKHIDYKGEGNRKDIIVISLKRLRH